MKPRLWRCLLLATVTLAGLLTLPVHAQPMPREDVVDVPAIGEGLCVSNVFQTNMVLQRDKPVSVWGWADPDEQVTVNFAGEQASAKAAEKLSWISWRMRLKASSMLGRPPMRPGSLLTSS